MNANYGDYQKQTHCKYHGITAGEKEDKDDYDDYGSETLTIPNSATVQNPTNLQKEKKSLHLEIPRLMEACNRFYLQMCVID